MSLLTKLSQKESKKTKEHKYTDILTDSLHTVKKKVKTLLGLCFFFEVFNVQFVFVSLKCTSALLSTISKRNSFLCSAEAVSSTPKIFFFESADVVHNFISHSCWRTSPYSLIRYLEDVNNIVVLQGKQSRPPLQESTKMEVILLETPPCRDGVP